MLRIVLILIAVFLLLLAKKDKGYKRVVFLAMCVIVILILPYIFPSMQNLRLFKDTPNSVSTNQQEQSSEDEDQQMSESERAYRDGLRAFNRRDYFSAAEYFSKVSMKDKFYPDALKKLNECVPYIQSDLLAKAKTAIENGDYETALTMLQNLLGYGPHAEAQKLLDFVNSKYNPRGYNISPQERTRIKRHYKQWNFGFGPVGIAVKEVRTSNEINAPEGFKYGIAGGFGKFLWLKISAYNESGKAVPVTTDEFYVSNQKGRRFVRHESTFSQQCIKDGVIPPKTSIEGWIIYLVPPNDKFTLHYFGDQAGVDIPIKK